MLMAKVDSIRDVCQNFQKARDAIRSDAQLNQVAVKQAGKVRISVLKSDKSIRGSAESCFAGFSALQTFLFYKGTGFTKTRFQRTMLKSSRRGSNHTTPAGEINTLPTEPLHTLQIRRKSDRGARTRDPDLGKVVLYQLSHCRLSKAVHSEQKL